MLVLLISNFLPKPENQNELSLSQVQILQHIKIKKNIKN